MSPAKRLRSSRFGDGMHPGPLGPETGFAQSCSRVQSETRIWRRLMSAGFRSYPNSWSWIAVSATPISLSTDAPLRPASYALEVREAIRNSVVYGPVALYGGDPRYWDAIESCLRQRSSGQRGRQRQPRHRLIRLRPEVRSLFLIAFSRWRSTWSTPHSRF